MVKRGVPDWILCKWTTLDDGKGHPSAKPALLYANLLRRSAYPGDLVCDPMFGTGPAFVACELCPDLKLTWKGWDNVKANRAKALVNLTEMIFKGGVDEE